MTSLSILILCMTSSSAAMVQLVVPSRSSAAKVQLGVPCSCAARSRGVLCMTDDTVQQKRLKAEQLQAQAAALEAEAAELEERARELDKMRSVRALEAEAAELEEQARELEKMRAQAELAVPTKPAELSVSEEELDEQGDVMALTSPLRYIGPYPAIALSFPELSSPAQKARQLSGDSTASGVTLDFLLDTGANTNTISSQVAAPTSQGGLDLTQVGSVASGIGAAGTFGGGATFLLGAVELADAPPADRVAFMSGLTATALPVAAPAACAGLLSSTFLNSFAGGVQFVWGAAPSATQIDGASSDTEDAARPSVTFYGDTAGTAPLKAALERAPIDVLPGSGLPSVTLMVNGVAIPALLDTGSPITVLNAAAAAKASVAHAQPPSVDGNPLAKLMGAAKLAQAAASGDVLTIGGVDGPVQLMRAEPAEVSLGAGVPFGEDVRLYVGELPGLQALDGLGAAAGPAAVLGTDVLRRREKLWYTPTEIFL